MRSTVDALVAVAAATVVVGVLCPAGVPAQPPASLVHGFDPWPTRRAFLAGGWGTGVHFTVSLDGSEARALFDQGIMQLHGLAHFEAERSFRQVAALEPSCAMAYWGVALANVGNPDRAAHFVEEAVRRRHLASPKERRLVDALAGFYEVSEVAPKAEAVEGVGFDVYEVPKRSFRRGFQERSSRLLAAWEAILGSAPDDIEIAALVVRQIWLNAVSKALVGPELHRQVARARELLTRIFARSPRHPAHFYRLQVDVFGDLQGALKSVGVAGHHAPRVAGHWSASARLLTGLHRHEDALEYFEAALRTAHGQLQRERALPFVLPGYADDAAGYSRCLMRLGRVKAALEWLDYLRHLPRHPRLNRADDPNSIAGHARRCLRELCAQYRRQDRRPDQGAPAGGAPQEHRRGDADAGAEEAALSRADALLADGRPQAAAKMLGEEARNRPNRVATLARMVGALVQAGDREQAATWLQRLRKVAGGADLEEAILAPATALARELGLPEDWRQPRNRAADWPRDIGPLPHLEALGPKRWSPPKPYAWVLRDGHGNKVRLEDYRGSPVVVVLHLGFG